MKLITIILMVLITTVSNAAVGEGGHGINAVGEGGHGLDAVGEGGHGLDAVGEGGHGIDAVGSLGYTKLGNGYVRNCFRINNAIACNISRF